MNKPSFKPAGINSVPQTFSIRHLYARTRNLSFLLLTASLCLLSCGKDTPESKETTVSKKNNGTVSVQPLPGGKRYFSVAVGKFVANDYTVARMERFTFTEAGTVNLEYFQWDSNAQKGKTYVNNHTCSMDGESETNNVYTPTGWIYPSSGHEVDIYGTYSFNPTTGILYCYWNSPNNPPGWNGLEESWNLTNPASGIALMTMRTNGYGLTHGRGYGSNATWSTFTQLLNIPRVNYPGYMVLISRNSSGGYTKDPATGTGWKTDAVDLTGWTSSANGNVLHVKKPNNPDRPTCTSGCRAGNPYDGMIYHLGGLNNSRKMLYNHYCACLTDPATHPYYASNLHPYAFDQIIDDSGVLRGFVGVEQQNQTGYNGAYQYQLKVYFK